MIGEKDALIAEAQTKLETATAEKEALEAKLTETENQLTELTLNYEGLVQQRDEYQKALEAKQDEINAQKMMEELNAVTESAPKQTPKMHK